MKKWFRSGDPAMDAVQNVKGEIGNLWKVIDALAEGYKWRVEPLIPAILVIENPDFKEDNGSNPNLVADVNDLIHMLILKERASREEAENRESDMDQLNRMEEQRNELEAKWRKMAEAVNALPELLPWKYQPSWMKR